LCTVKTANLRNLTPRVNGNAIVSIQREINELRLDHEY